MIDRIDISEIVIPKSHREPKRVESLAESIKHVGQINAIIVRDDMQLIAGGRRLAACKLLGLTEILASVLTVSDIDAELMEIDENLERHELSAFDRSKQLLRRKELYEARYPTTKHGGSPGKKGGGKQTSLESKDETVSSFADNAAEKMGVSPRTIQQDIQIAENIDSEIGEMIEGTDLEDRKVDLLVLSRLPKEEQGPVVEEIAKAKRAGKKTTVAKVKKERSLGKPKKSKNPKKELESEPTNGPTGKSEVNDKVVDDPPDVDELRRQGKIPTGTIPEVTEPDGDATKIGPIREGMDEEKAMMDDALSDEDWLAKLPLYGQLADICLKTFCEDALAYRALEKHRKTFIWYVTRTVNKLCRKGPYSYKLNRFLAINHPKDWVKCSAPEYGGCGGNGTSPLTGLCSTCRGSGYRING